MKQLIVTVITVTAVTVTASTIKSHWGKSVQSIGIPSLRDIFLNASFKSVSLGTACQ